MLQALTMETTTAPVKIRNGSSGDSADGLFAGLMAQASSASTVPAPATAPEPETAREDRVESRAAPRPGSSEVQDAAQPREKPRTDAPSEEEDSNPAKAAVKNPKPEEAKISDSAKVEKPDKVSPETTTAAVQPQVATQPEGTGSQMVDPNLPVPVPEVAQASAQAASTPLDPNIKATQQEPQTAEPATPKGPSVKLAQTTQDPAKTPAGSAKPALTELLYLPKADIQTPKWNSEPAKASQVDSKNPMLVNAEEPSSGTKTETAPAPAPEPASETGQKANQAKAALSDDAVALGMNKPESHAVQAAKVATPSLETPVVAQGEGIRAGITSSSSRVESSAVARPIPVLAQVEGSIRWILQNKSQGAELQLHPESLGRVIIQLRVEGQDVHARLWASEASSLSVLQDHKAFLESSLKEQGLNLSSFDLQSGARGDGAQTAQQDRSPVAAPRNLPHLEVKQEMPMGSALDSLEAHQIEVYA